MPSRVEMLADTDNDFEKRKVMDNHKAHFYGPAMQSQYYEELATAACVEPLKPVFGNIFSHLFESIFKNFNSFRNYRYKIINDEEFECKLID